SHPDGHLALTRIRCRRRLGQVHRYTLRVDFGSAEAGELVEAHPYGCIPGHGAHVHREAVHRTESDESFLYAPTDRGSHRTAAGHAMNEVRVNRRAADRIESG